MFKIRILDNTFHTFHSYRKQFNEFKNRGILFGDHTMQNYDLTMIGSSLFQDKKLGSFEASLQKGMDFLKTVDGPYILVDGQDSASVIGAFETFVESDAIVMLKQTLYKDRDFYKRPMVGGRYYWRTSESHGIANQNYVPKDFDKYSDRIMLTGTNWIGITDVRWYDYSEADKLFDVFSLVGYPHPECHEFDLKPSQDFYYNSHRKLAFDIINKSPFMVAKLYDGRRVDSQTYYKYLMTSKVITALVGYGEMAPRDIESAMFGSLLIKPDISHVETYPNIFKENETYIPCEHDYSDLEEKIEYAVLNFDELRDFYVNNMRQEYEKQYHSTYLVDYTEQLFKNIGIL